MPKQTIEIDVPEGMRVGRVLHRGRMPYDKSAEYTVEFVAAWQPTACLKEAEWFARDERGSWWAFISKPTLGDTQWLPCVGHSSSVLFLLEFAGETWTPPVADDVDWKETLTRNPWKDEA